MNITKTVEKVYPDGCRLISCYDGWNSVAIPYDYWLENKNHEVVGFMSETWVKSEVQRRVGYEGWELVKVVNPKKDLFTSEDPELNRPFKDGEIVVLAKVALHESLSVSKFAEYDYLHSLLNANLRLDQKDG